MLTPPGLKGKQYRISGKAYPRLSRPGQKRRRVFQVLGAVVALAVIGWGTVQLVAQFGGKKKSATAAAGHCVRPATAAGDAAKASASPHASGAAASGAAGAPGASASAGASGAAGSAGGVVLPLPSGMPQPATVTVNVYNATGHAGLAGQTASLLRQRGFKIGKIANAPATLEGKITGAAQVTGANGSKAAMTLVGSEVTGATTTTDTRTDGSVDLVIGNGFTALLSPAQASQALALAVSPSPTAGAHC
ncbi:LytR C-terminal domain-containing protein [Streptacidiphilus sp. MAP12-33]|uniref:LytR C-terminal domain-containing protein n=1 Tax=Streptacidiphilus sp. MAP12-33 TaxID=3156266 RepID=UPI003511B1F0